jgi:tetratricopeptide (TPR) repeat protein
LRRNLMAVAFWAAALLPTIVFAQLDKSFRVQIELVGGPPGRNMAIELIDLVKHTRVQVQPSPRGTFDLEAAAGSYQIRVIAADGSVLRQEQLNVSPTTGTVVINVPFSEPDQPSGGTVSVGQLRHKVPGKARKAFAAAEKKYEKGDYKGSLQFLEQAVQIDPEYVEAHNNIGCRLLNLNRAEEALVAFQRALEIDPRLPFTHGNIAAAMLFLHRPAEAEAAARAAVELDGSSSKGRFLLGVSLVQQKKFTREAAQNLRKSEIDFPRARLAAAIVLEHLGEVNEAKQELQGYLSDSSSEKRTEVQAWLARLK